MRILIALIVMTIYVSPGLAVADDCFCHGCGCKGGPGWRSKPHGQCVHWNMMDEICGNPPGPPCIREAAPQVCFDQDSDRRPSAIDPETHPDAAKQSSTLPSTVSNNRSEPTQKVYVGIVEEPDERQPARIWFPDLHGCIVIGADGAEVRGKAAEVIAGCLKERVKKGAEIPAPSSLAELQSDPQFAALVKDREIVLVSPN